MVDDNSAKRALMSFMSARCEVTSQHKLPGKDEILSTTLAEFIGRERAGRLIDEMIEDDTLIAYGPYISDHQIDVL